MKILLDKIMYQKNMSIRQVSLLTGVSKSSVQECMNENSNPKIQTLEKLAQGLKCHITEFSSRICRLLNVTKDKLTETEVHKMSYKKLIAEMHYKHILNERVWRL